MRETNMRNMIGRQAVSAFCLVLALALPAAAQPPQGQPSARDAAPWDPTGQWVALVTEDWRFRMTTAPAGDYEGFSMTPAARQIADNWDPAADEAAGEACRAYGAGGIMRMPTRLRIDWESDNVLSIETDAGMQTRLLKFGSAQDGAGAGSRQGVSNADWQLEREGGFRSPVVNGSLAVTTAGMRPGYVRRNGVPYSGNATLTEYFERVAQDNGDEYLIVISILNDPEYHTAPVITSSNFKRESDAADMWNPRPCVAR